MKNFIQTKRVPKKITWKQIRNWHWYTKSCTMVLEHSNGKPNSIYGCPLYQVAWHMLRFQANGTTKIVRIKFDHGSKRMYEVDLESADYVLKSNRLTKFAADVVLK